MMQDYSKLVKALRICADDSTGCGECPFVGKCVHAYYMDLKLAAAAAIEELQAEVERLQVASNALNALDNAQDVIKRIPTIDAVPAAPRWVRCEERLPDDSRDVIIFHTSGIVGVGSFIRPNWYQWYSGGGLPVDVTHWMPLPEPPQEVQE